MAIGWSVYANTGDVRLHKRLGLHRRDLHRGTYACVCVYVYLCMCVHVHVYVKCVRIISIYMLHVYNTEAVRR